MHYEIMALKGATIANYLFYFLFGGYLVWHYNGAHQKL
jgi:hypothetical protein